MSTASRVTAALQNGDTALAERLRDDWCAARYGDIPCAELADWAMNVDRVIIEHDAYCCCDEVCAVNEERRLLDSLLHEEDRRVRNGITITDPNAPTLEDRLGPYGLEWQREQNERIYA